jgi:hypothetical protein
MPTPLMNLRVPPAERAAWVRAAEGASLSLSRWIRDTLNAAAAATVEAQEERPAEAERQRRRERERPEVLRAADAAVAALQREDPGPVVEPPAEEDPMYRVGRCRTHPGALPRFNDYSRCAWGCRLPEG